VNQRVILSAQLAADMFEGRVLFWNDSRVQAENPHIAHMLPATAMVRVVRSDNSTATAAFARYMADASSSFRIGSIESEGASASMPRWPTDCVAACSDNTGLLLDTH